jgi:hypothetical protein
MMPFSKARQIAEAWVSAVTEGQAEIVREAVEAKPYGWIFYYQSREFLADRSNISAALAGNAPFIVDRINGEVRVLGTGPLREQRLREYEKSLPSAVWHAKPELPQW